MLYMAPHRARPRFQNTPVLIPDAGPGFALESRSRAPGFPFALVSRSRAPELPFALVSRSQGNPGSEADRDDTSRAIGGMSFPIKNPDLSGPRRDHGPNRPPEPHGLTSGNLPRSRPSGFPESLKPEHPAASQHRPRAIRRLNTAKHGVMLRNVKRRNRWCLRSAIALQ